MMIHLCVGCVVVDISYHLETQTSSYCVIKMEAGQILYVKVCEIMLAPFETQSLNSELDIGYQGESI